MTATTETMLFDGADHVAEVAEEYKTRLTAVKARIDAYECDGGRRYATDEYHAAAQRLRGAAGWLAGDYDVSYAGPHPSFGSTLQDFRVHYANDSLRTALHHIVWAESYAGLRDRESAISADPWNNR